MATRPPAKLGPGGCRKEPALAFLQSIDTPIRTLEILEASHLTSRGCWGGKEGKIDEEVQLSVPRSHNNNLKIAKSNSKSDLRREEERNEGRNKSLEGSQLSKISKVPL